MTLPVKTYIVDEVKNSKRILFRGLQINHTVFNICHNFENYLQGFP